jgi:hypothetical protein
MSSEILDKSLKDYYIETLRDKLTDTVALIKDDPNVDKTCEKIVNVIDTNINYLTAEAKEIIEEAIVPLASVVSQKEYYVKKNIQLLTDEDKEKIKDLGESCAMFLTMMKSEKAVKKEKTDEPERINYKSDDASNDASRGENKDYSTHNIKELNKKIDNPIYPNTTK